jgi:hypothetical protein
MDTVNRASKYGRSRNNPKKIVLHAMAEFIRIDSSASKWYADQGKDIPVGDYFAPDWLDVLGLSAHVFVTPSGLNIVTRKDTEGAYHAGIHNKDSLGIEFLVPGVYDYGGFIEAMKRPYLTKPQFYEGLEMVKRWMDKWNIFSDEVFIHSELDSKKKDPGQGFIDSGFLNEIK